MKFLIVVVALALPATPIVGQDIFTTSVSEYMDAEAGTQYTINGYVIGLYQMATDVDAKPVTECIEKWLARPSNDGLGVLTEWMHDAVILAELEAKGEESVAVVLAGAILQTCA